MIGFILCWIPLEIMLGNVLGGSIFPLMLRFQVGAGKHAEGGKQLKQSDFILRRQVSMRLAKRRNCLKRQALHIVSFWRGKIFFAQYSRGPALWQHERHTPTGTKKFLLEHSVFLSMRSLQRGLVCCRLKLHLNCVKKTHSGQIGSPVLTHYVCLMKTILN